MAVGPCPQALSKRGRGSHLAGGIGTALARGAASLSAVVYPFRRNLPRHRRGSRLAGGLVPHCLEELYSSLRLCTLSAGTDQSIVGDPVWQDALVPHYLEELQGSLRLYPVRRH